MKEDILRAVGSIMAQGENLNFVGKYDMSLYENILVWQTLLYKNIHARYLQSNKLYIKYNHQNLSGYFAIKYPPKSVDLLVYKFWSTRNVFFW